MSISSLTSMWNIFCTLFQNLYTLVTLLTLHPFFCIYIWTAGCTKQSIQYNCAGEERIGAWSYWIIYPSHCSFPQPLSRCFHPKRLTVCRLQEQSLKSSLLKGTFVREEAWDLKNSPVTGSPLLGTPSSSLIHHPHRAKALNHLCPRSCCIVAHWIPWILKLLKNTAYATNWSLIFIPQRQHNSSRVEYCRNADGEIMQRHAWPVKTVMPAYEQWLGKRLNDSIHWFFYQTCSYHSILQQIKPLISHLDIRHY